MNLKLTFLLFSLSCTHLARATKPNILAGIMASHVLDNKNNSFLNVSHVITTRIEETLNNGCYKQIIHETSSDNLNNTQETLVWICPPGTPKESIPQLGLICSKDCECAFTTQNNHTKANTTITKDPHDIGIHNTTKQPEITAKPHLVAGRITTENEPQITNFQGKPYLVADYIDHNSAVGSRPMHFLLLYISILHVINNV